MRRLAFTVWFGCVLVWGQMKPVEIAGSCSAEVVQNLSLNCSPEDPCPLYLELAAAEQIGNRLLITGNLHTGAATIESVLLVSDDGGRSWTEPHARIPAAVLDQVQFIDVETGWVNGHLLLNVPRDAFFLLTTDGGKTWRKRPITSESRTGAVEAFWFDSRTSGKLALDRVRAAENGLRYEIWESMTGGDSWSIRQVDSKPVPFRKPLAEPSMRLRTDGASKSYRLERRDGAQWSPVASFAVSAGQCRPPAPAATEAPPPEPEPAAQEPAQLPSVRTRPPSLKKPK